MNTEMPLIVMPESAGGSAGVPNDMCFDRVAIGGRPAPGRAKDAGGEHGAGQRHEVAFNGCFGWLHASAGAGSDIAVLLCPGLLADGRSGHRSFRLLADALAAAGMPSLRFDYPGTGDSLDAGGAELWALWQQSIHAAADWLRAQTGARRIVLCGLRIGATLAATVAAQREDIAGLILFEPVMRGASFIRQLTVEARLHGSTAASGDETLALHELQMGAATLAAIRAADLAQLAPRCATIIFSATASPAIAACAAAWRTRGCETETADFGGLEPLLRPSFMNHEGAADFTPVLRWLTLRLAPQQGGRSIASPDEAILSPPRCTERPLRFGLARHLSGILCEPATPGPAPGRIVLLVNSGGDPRYGVARLNVTLARRLAAAGIASLRFDLAGLGDSTTGEDDAPTHIFERDRTREFAAAMDALGVRGYRRFAVAGLCSGAFHAWQAALGDPRIDRLALINLPFFAWREGDLVEHVLNYKYAPTVLGYLRKLCTAESLALLRAGRLNLRDPVGIVWVRSVETSRKVARRLAGLLRLRQSPTPARLGMAALRARGVQTLFLFSASDGGIDTMEQEFAGRLPPGAAMHIIPAFDHSLTTPEMQTLAAEHVRALLRDAPAP